MDPGGEFVAELIAGSARVLAREILDRQEALGSGSAPAPDAPTPDLAQDTELRLAYLGEALAAARPLLFLDQVAWLKVALPPRGLSLAALDANLECMASVLEERLPADHVRPVRDCLVAARAHLARAPSRLRSHLEEGVPHVDLARRYVLAVLEARAADAIGLVREAHARGVTAAELYEHVILRGQREIGRMWQMNEVHVAEEHLATHIAARAMSVVDQGEQAGPARHGRVLCAAVAGELHDTGLRAVADHLRWAGYDIVMLGASTPAADLIYAVIDFAPDVLALSASLALQVRATAKLIRTLRSRLEAPPPILAGGRPFSLVSDLWKVVGADASASDAAGAVTSVEEQLARRPAAP